MKRKISMVLASIMVLSSLMGCGQSATNTKDSVSAGTEASVKETSVDSGQEAAGEKIFRYSETTVSSNINPFENNTTITDYVQAKLYRYIPEDQEGSAISITTLVPELAKGEPTTEDGYTWEIEIEPEAKWANGDPINADTFMYSWKMALDPKLLYSATSGLAKNVIEIENAYDYYTQLSTGKEVAWEDVGLKKVDDHTVSVTTTQRYTAKQVMQHFQMRYTGPVYEPLFEAGMDAERSSTNYGTEAKYFMSCGPFELTSWTKGAERVFERNENYICADEIALDGMYVRVVADEATQLELFQAGELDFLILGASGFEVYGEDPRVSRDLTGSTRGIEINFKNPDKPYLDNVNFRKALYYAVDRATIAKLNNKEPAPYFLSPIYSLSADGTKLLDLPEAQSYIPENYGYNPELAVEYFEKALQETGVSSVSVNLIYNEAVGALRSASEYLQKSLQDIFGEDRFTMTVTAMNNTEAGKLMQTSQNGPTNGWDLCWGAWDLTAAVISANRKFEVYTSTDKRRFSGYYNDEVDRLYALSVTEEYRMDEDKLIDVTLQMEKSHLEHVDSIPVFNEVTYALFGDRVIRPAKTRINFVGYCYQLMDIAE